MRCGLDQFGCHSCCAVLNKTQPYSIPATGQQAYCFLVGSLVPVGILLSLLLDWLAVSPAWW